MACIITYKNNKYSQQEFEKYFKNNFNEFVNEFLSQDIKGFKEFVKTNKPIDNRINPNKMTQAFTKYGVELPMEEVFEKMYPYSKSLFKNVKAKIGEIAKFPLSAEENRDINE